jgi:hypothetical protein
MLSHQCFSGSVSVLSAFQCSSDAESSVLQWHQCRCFQCFSASVALGSTVRQWHQCRWCRCSVNRHRTSLPIPIPIPIPTNTNTNTDQYRPIPIPIPQYRIGIVTSLVPGAIFRWKTKVHETVWNLHQCSQFYKLIQNIMLFLSKVLIFLAKMYEIRVKKA